MLAHNKTPVTGWFADVPAWEGNDTRPAQLLADELVAQGRIGTPHESEAPLEGAPVASADEWGWLGADEAPLTTPHVDVDEVAPPVEVDEPAPVDVSLKGGDSTSPPQSLQARNFSTIQASWPTGESCSA